MRRHDMLLAGGLVAAVAFVSGCSRASTAAPPPSTPDVSGVWLGVGIQSLSPSDPTGKKRPGQEGDIPYTPWAIEKMKTERPATGPDQTLEDTNDPSLRYSDPNGYPRVSIHPMRFKIVQTKDFIYQLWEYNLNWRQIAMNKSHSEAADITWFGDSVGKWEGDTLVVDVIGLKDSTWLDPIGHPHSEDLHIIERIRRVDPDTLVFDLTFEDSKVYTKPWTSQLKFKLMRDGIMTENVYTISDELRFRERFLGEKSTVPIRR